MDKFVDKLMNIEPGETELDYIPKDEIEKIKKGITKKYLHPYLWDLEHLQFLRSLCSPD